MGTKKRGQTHKVRLHNPYDFALMLFVYQMFVLGFAQTHFIFSRKNSRSAKYKQVCFCSHLIVPKGGYVGDKDGVVIPSIPAHGNYIIKVKWHVPKPEDYIGCYAVENQLQHFAYWHAFTTDILSCTKTKVARV